jgi:nucleotide-binding universal stress UspA family protein
MKDIDNLILVTDFGGGASEASKIAVFVAKSFDAQIILVHVVETAPDPFTGLKVVRERVAMHLEKERKKLVKAGAPRVKAVLLTGNASDQITRYTDINEVDLILIASGEKEKSKVFQLGLTASGVIRNSKVPVWMVKRGAVPDIKKIICPVDLSDPSKRAMASAVGLARCFGAELMVITVIPPILKQYRGIGKLAADAERKYVLRHKAQCERFLLGYDLAGVKWKKRVRRGKPHRIVLKLIDEISGDLLVMGSVGKSGLSRNVIGDVAYKIIREIPCSVISTKSAQPMKVQIEKDLADIEVGFKKGNDLLAKGHPQEAALQFEWCRSKDKFYAPAWEGLSLAHEQTRAPAPRQGVPRYRPDDLPLALRQEAETAHALR